MKIMMNLSQTVLNLSTNKDIDMCVKEYILNLLEGDILRIKWRKTFVYLAVIMMVTSTSMPLYAKSVTDLNKDKKDLNSQADSAKQALNQTQNEQKTVFSEINQLDANIENVENELESIGNQLEDTKKTLANTETALAEAVKKKETQYETTKKRMKYLYENGSIGYFDVLLDSKGFSDFLNRMEYINDIMQYDNKVFESMKATQQSIETKKAEIVTKQKSIELLAKEQTAKKHGLEETKSQKAQVLAKLETDEASYEAKLKQIEADSQQIESLIKKAQEEAARKAAAAAASGAGASKYTGGVMMWPLDGYYSISSSYGSRSSPISGRGEVHRGIDIPAPANTPVHAAADGVVIFAGWNNSYGNMIIIDHGGGISSVYAHNTSLVARVGQSVSRGDVVSKVGSTGDSTGNHCHFEVRVNGQYTSPMPYLSK
jgi:murein DD-endopeptidase MepM/ murein hydrolase activator NlpD